MLNSAIELHDTTVGSILVQEGEIVLFLSSAYIHKSEGIPGVDSGSGWGQAFTMVFSDASLTGSIPELPEDISRGRIQIGQQILRNMIPLPFSTQEATQMTIVFGTGEELTIRGSKATLKQEGEATYIEEFPG